MTRKLLQINPVVRQSTSTGRIMREIGELAISCGWESYIAYSGGRDGVPQHSSALLPTGNRADVLLHAAATRLFDAHGLASVQATKRLTERISALDPDIIHIHNVHGYWLNYPLFFDYLRQSGKPVVWTVHDCWLYTGHCYYYSYARCEKWRTGCGNCPQKHSFPASWLFDRSAANWRDKRDAFGSLPNLTLVPVSDWIRQEMASSFLSGHEFRVIRNGIDLDVFSPRAVEKDAGTVYLGVASIWLEEKGFPDLMRLAGLLRDDERLVLIGRMTPAQKRRVPPGVLTVERTEDVHGLAAMYARSSVLLNPTWQDNYPTVNLESIACGTPVVTYRTGGSVEAVTGDTGRVVPQGDVSAMLDCARELASADRSATSLRCREYAEAHFGKESCYRNYIELYESLATR